MATEKLTLKQEQALSALLISPTIAGAASAAGVSSSSLSMWIHADPVFGKRLQEANEARLKAAVALSVNQLGLSFQTLAKIRDDTSATAGVRVRAAHTLITLHLKARALTDVISRIEQIEQVLSEYLLPAGRAT